jgi:tetratricopeptide (TPR) repeat protein
MGVLFLSAAYAQPASQALKDCAAGIQRGEAEQAVHACEGALALDPQSAPAHMLLGRAYLAQRSVTKMGEAKAELQEALALDPHLLWARFYLAKAYIDLGKYDKAKEELERGLTDRPGVPMFLALLGEVERKRKHPETSLALNRKALAADPSLTPAHYHLALAHMDLHQNDDAVKELETSLRSQYVAPEMYLTLGSLYTRRQRYAEAEELCKKAIALDPSRPEGYLHLAQLYNVQNLSEKALAALKLTLPDGKNFPATAYYQELQSDVWFEAGRAYLAKRQWTEAIQAYSRSLELNANRKEAHARLAEIYTRKGDKIRAREHAAAADK